MTAVFNPRGRIALITSTASGNGAGGIGPGDSAGPLGSRARRLTPGLWLGRNGYVYGARGGRVSFVAVAAASELRSAAQLRSDLRAAGL